MAIALSPVVIPRSCATILRDNWLGSMKTKSSKGTLAPGVKRLKLVEAIASDWFARSIGFPQQQCRQGAQRVRK